MARKTEKLFLIDQSTHTPPPFSSIIEQLFLLIGNVEYLKGLSKTLKTKLAHDIAKQDTWRELGCVFDKSHKFKITEEDLKNKYFEYSVMGLGADIFLCERLIEELESKNITVDELIAALEHDNINMHDMADELRDKIYPNNAVEVKTAEQDPDWEPEPLEETPRKNSRGATKRKQNEISPPAVRGPREKRRRDNSCHGITFSYLGKYEGRSPYNCHYIGLILFEPRGICGRKRIQM